MTIDEFEELFEAKHHIERAMEIIGQNDEIHLLNVPLAIALLKIKDLLYWDTEEED